MLGLVKKSCNKILDRIFNWLIRRTILSSEIYLKNYISEEFVKRDSWINSYFDKLDSSIADMVRRVVRDNGYGSGGTLISSHKAILYLNPKQEYTLAEFEGEGRFAGSICTNGMPSSRGTLAVYTLTTDSKEKNHWRLMQAVPLIGVGVNSPEVTYIDPIYTASGVKVTFKLEDGTNDQYIYYDWLWKRP